ncbi:MAG: hypothetical protein ACR2P5_06535 [Gammaproteobacteria bacterium]
MDITEIRNRLDGNRAEIRQKMVDAAKNASTLSYGDLFSPYGMDMGYDSQRALAGTFLGEICAEEHNAGRHLLSVLVVHADDKKPGDGFFGLADELGFSINKRSPSNKKTEFFVKQLKLVYDYWAKH